MDVINQSSHPISIKWVYKYLLTLVLVMFAVLALVYLLLRFSDYAQEDFAIFLIVLSIFFGVLLTIFSILLVGWRARFEYQIDKESIGVKQGFVSRADNRYSISQIKEVICSQSLLDRFFGINTVTIKLADDASVDHGNYADDISRSMGTFLGVDTSHIVTLVNRNRIILGGLSAQSAATICQQFK